MKTKVNTEERSNLHIIFFPQEEIKTIGKKIKPINKQSSKF